MFYRDIYVRRRIIIGLISLFLVITTIWVGSLAFRYFQNRLKYSKITVIEGKLHPGQVLFEALIEANISRDGANELIASVGKILDMTSLQVKDEFRVYLNDKKQIEKFIYEKSPIDQYFVVRGEYGKLHAFKPAIFLEKEILSKEFEIKSSLFEAMLKAGEKEALIFNFVDVFAWDIDFFIYPRVGDKIRIYYEKYYKDGEFMKYGRILAAQYKGREDFNALYFEPKKNQAGYYNLQGKPTEKMFLKTPLKFTARITSLFGWRRDPISHRHGRHTGVDFAAPYGSPVVATSSGTVTHSGWLGGYGKLVIVRHANGYSTYYGHNSRILVRRGQRVSQGQVIANVGSTGWSTGPHCHYEIRYKNNAMNPLKFNTPKLKPLAGKDLKDFENYSKKVWKNIEGI
jgi:murein DD-endopeptidase MepM/ murein hydrolase activator NlpD